MESVARRTGLALSTEILCGVHDSNANLFRYKAAGMADASILSTGTWMIGFQRGLPLDKLDCARAMVLNIDVDGENAPSTLIAAGREYDLIRGEHFASDAAVLAALPTLLSRGTLALPSFVGDDGLFPGAARRGRVIGPPPETPAEWQALAVLYAAFSANRCLDALESSKTHSHRWWLCRKPALRPLSCDFAILAECLGESISRRNGAWRCAAVAAVLAYAAGFKRDP
ncbi:sugar (pentulose or hexulose) kinase [Bradyrhizobium sp. GM7.3]